MQRRQLLLLGLGLAAFDSGRAGAETETDPDLDVSELDLGGERQPAHRARLIVPARAAGARLPLVVLLHGLGETKSPKLGLKAWTELYGLLAAYRRLRRPPLAPGKHGYLTEQRRAELNRELAERPFGGVVTVCPVTPNVYARGPGSLERYADWIADTLLPAARAHAAVDPRSEATAVDGCSLGGYVALEVFLRKPELFGCAGSVQGAFSPQRAAAYAERIADVTRRVGPRRVHVQSSSRDPYRCAAERLARELGRLKVAHELTITPGPHDQPWLRESGTLEMLLWYDRALPRTG